jgi:type II secretory pathway component PulJ
MTARRGQGLMEALLAVLIAVLVFAMASDASTAGYRTAARSAERHGRREGALRALTQLRHTLVDAHEYRIATDHLEFTTRTGEASLLREAASGALLYRRPGQARAERLLRDRVSRLEVVELRPGLLKVTIGLAGKPVPLELSDIIYLEAHRR